MQAIYAQCQPKRDSFELNRDPLGNQFHASPVTLQPVSGAIPLKRVNVAVVDFPSRILCGWGPLSRPQQRVTPENRSHPRWR
jgi:hypothetical protein